MYRCEGKTKKYWYEFDIYYCVLCGKETIYKERKFSKKPDNINERFHYHESACANHF
jgi:hypothetical protein